MTGKFKYQISNIKFLALLGIIIVIILAAAPTQKQTRQTKIPPSSPSPAPLVLTEDEKFILNPPPADASRSALQKHAKMVAALAKPTDTLEITSCRPNPLVLSVKYGAQVKIQNNDAVKQLIIIDSKHFYELPANNSLTIKVDFKYGTGDYGYVCGGAGIAGFMHVES